MVASTAVAMLVICVVGNLCRLALFRITKRSAEEYPEECTEEYTEHQGNETGNEKPVATHKE